VKQHHVIALTTDGRKVQFRYGQAVDGFRLQTYRVVVPPRCLEDERWLERALQPRLMPNPNWTAIDWDPYL